MKYMILVIAAILVMALLAASELYFESPASRAEQYTIAQRTLSVVGTQVVQMDAIQLTVEAAAPMQTQYAVAIQEQDALLATQDALLNARPAPITNNGDTVVEASFSVQANSTPQPTIQVNGQYSAVVSTGIDSDGCALGQQDTFTISGADDPTEIYFVANARNVQAGSRFQSRWYPNADEMSNYTSVTWTADADYPQTCIYFWINSSDIAYQSGTWTVELLENGVVVQTQSFRMCITNESCV